jgi:hypothetical protein
MIDRSGEPLSEMDKLVFGHDARRRADGSIIESGSSHDRDVVAHRDTLDRRSAEAANPPRELDMRNVHPFPTMMQ